MLWNCTFVDYYQNVIVLQITKKYFLGAMENSFSIALTSHKTTKASLSKFAFKFLTTSNIWWRSIEIVLIFWQGISWWKSMFLLNQFLDFRCMHSIVRWLHIKISKILFFHNKNSASFYVFLVQKYFIMYFKCFTNICSLLPRTWHSRYMTFNF